MTTAKSVMLGSGSDRIMRTIEFERDFEKTLILSMPTGSSCVRAVDGKNIELPDGEDPTFYLVYPYSRIDMIDPAGSHAGPTLTIFGKEPEHGWCYYYEKMSLARQQGDWPEVARLSDEAQQLGLRPRDRSEWMPALESLHLRKPRGRCQAPGSDTQRSAGELAPGMRNRARPAVPGELILTILNRETFFPRCCAAKPFYTAFTRTQRSDNLGNRRIRIDPEAIKSGSRQRKTQQGAKMNPFCLILKKFILAGFLIEPPGRRSADFSECGRPGLRWRSGGEPAGGPNPAPQNGPGVQEVRTARLERLYQRELRLLDRQAARLERIDDLTVRAQQLIDRLKENGVNTQVLEEALADFKAALPAARSAHDRARAILEAHVGFQRQRQGDRCRCSTRDREDRWGGAQGGSQGHPGWLPRLAADGAAVPPAKSGPETGTLAGAGALAGGPSERGLDRSDQPSKINRNGRVAK